MRRGICSLFTPAALDFWVPDREIKPTLGRPCSIQVISNTGQFSLQNVAARSGILPWVLSWGSCGRVMHKLMPGPLESPPTTLVLSSPTSRTRQEMSEVMPHATVGYELYEQGTFQVRKWCGREGHALALCRQQVEFLSCSLTVHLRPAT